MDGPPLTLRFFNLRSLIGCCGSSWTNLAIDSNGTVVSLRDDGSLAAYDPSSDTLSVLRDVGFVNPCCPRGFSILSVPPPVSDADNDELTGADDNCAAIWNPTQDDDDSDGLGNVCDNLPEQANFSQGSVLYPGAGITKGSVTDFAKREFNAQDDELAFSIRVPFQRAGEDSFTGRGFSIPYVGIQHDGQDLFPFFIAEETDGSFTIKWRTTLEATSSGSIDDADAGNLRDAGPQVDNIIGPGTGVDL